MRAADILLWWLPLILILSAVIHGVLAIILQPLKWAIEKSPLAVYLSYLAIAALAVACCSPKH
jgi:hypothetical protein